MTILAIAIALTLSGCATKQPASDAPVTKRDKTVKGAAIGAASGAVLGAVVGEGEADKILIGAAVGAGIGAGVGAYMDKQEARLARIPGTTVERVSDNMILVHFDSDVLFDVNSAALGAGSRSALDSAASVFHEYRKTAIVIQGHTDSSGSESFNEDLSKRRAQSVEAYLIGRGVDPPRMAAIGYGEAQPVADNNTADGRVRNRRVDLLLKASVR
jgi:outer membrane protein OmpA-like peptidoglycan-associated protein